MRLNKYQHDDWILYWSGAKWSPLGVSTWIPLYTRKPFLKNIDYFVNQTVIVWDGESTTNYIRESERKIFGKKVVEEVVKDPKYVDFISKGFKTGTDIILSIYNKNQKEFTHQEYQEYRDTFLRDYYIYHLQVKNVVDFLPKELLDIYFPKLESARVHAEPVFSQEIYFIERLAKHIGKKSGYQAKNIPFLFFDELMTYWRDKKNLPKEEILEERRKSCVMFFENGKIVDVLVGKDISKFNSIFLESKSKNDILEGQIVFKGKATGIVRIIFDPLDIKEFNKGDVLVAPWTRPEYLPIMKKAAAFITDGGGILSHAAIVARELKKPCVIGTKTATKSLKDGDRVEVDANKGIIKIIK